MSVCLGTDRTGTVEFQILSKGRIEEALDVQRQSMRQECIAIGMGMYEDPGAPEEMQLVFREVIKDGCTVIAVDRSDRVVAVAFNKLHASTMFLYRKFRYPVLISVPCALRCYRKDNALFSIVLQTFDISNITYL